MYLLIAVIVVAVVVYSVAIIVRPKVLQQKLTGVLRRSSLKLLGKDIDGNGGGATLQIKDLDDFQWIQKQVRKDRIRIRTMTDEVVVRSKRQGQPAVESISASIFIPSKNFPAALLEMFIGQSILILWPSGKLYSPCLSICMQNVPVASYDLENASIFWLLYPIKPNFTVPAPSS